MEVWAGIVGVVVGGFLMLVGNIFTNRSADGRLMLQFEHEERQRQRTEILAVELESIARIQETIDMTQQALPELIRIADGSKIMRGEIAEPLMSSLQRAVVTMMALGCSRSELDAVRGAVTALLDSEDVSTANFRIGILTNALASLQARHNDLKQQAIRDNES